MKALFFAVTLGLSITAFAETASQTATGIALDAAWKQQVYEYAKATVKHPSWGLAHSERNYQVTLDLAAKEGVAIDRDVLFVSAFLHDLGGIEGHEADGVDHAVQSVALIEPLLKEWNFPMDKFEQVKEMILGHNYYGEKPKSIQAQAFRDADLLDFLGTIGVARILAITLEPGRTDATLNPPVNILKSFLKALPSKCSLNACSPIADTRKNELEQFLKNLDLQSFGGKAL